MKLTVQQQKLVEDNIGLVGKVIKDKVHGVNQMGFYTYDDIFQIGCIGLSKAAATDKGGVFSTYAYRLIWNEICDALIYASRRVSKEELTDDFTSVRKSEMSAQFNDTGIEIYDIINKAKSKASPSVAMGIDALLLMNKGNTAKEIGKQFNKTANTITAVVSKAKKYLRECPELRALYGEPI